MFSYIRNLFLPANDKEAKPTKQTIYQIAEDNLGIITGYQFSATMSIRTPLNLLERHGEIASKIEDVDGRYGIWLPKVSSKFDFLDQGASMASSIGQIPLDGGEFLPFLINVRKIIERVTENTPDIVDSFNKCKDIRQLPHGHTYHQNDGFLKKSDELVNYFDLIFKTEENLFSHVMHEVSNHDYKGLTIQHIIELSKAGFDSIESILNAPDDILLSLTGVGKKKLLMIRGNLK